MNIILLSGGSGKRLWPLSNNIRSKQFIKIFKTDVGYESMAQRMYRQIKRIDSDAKVTVATAKSQISEIHNQLGDDVGISVEPFRRDTFPAIVLAASYLHDIQGVSENEAVVVCPVDPYVDDEYFKALKKLAELTDRGTAKLVLMGMEPTYPSGKYGYIVPESKDIVAPVSAFKEKPDVETAKKYIKDGALWNAGIFAFKLSYVLNRAHELIDFSDYEDLYGKYDTLQKISFDYAVVEKESSIAVMRFSGIWKDLGTWNTLTEAMAEKSIGNVISDENENVHVLNNLDIPVLVMGLKNAVVATSPDGILVTDKEQSSRIKPYVDKIEQPVRYAEKSWGSFQVMDVETESMTIKITLKPGHRMNYHSHDRRDEIWTIVSGCGKTVVDGMEQNVRPGDVITMQAGCRHTLINDGDKPLQAIEVQLGRDIDVKDKHKFVLEK